MESLSSTYQHLFSSPGTIASVPEFLLATSELLFVGVLVAWFVAHAAKLLIDADRIGISNRNRLAVSWATIMLGIGMMVDIAVLLFLDRIREPGWTAVAPHAAFVIIMAAIAAIVLFSINSELRQYRVYVESARKQAA